MEKTEALVLMTLILGVVLIFGQIGHCVVEGSKAEQNAPRPKPCAETQPAK